MPGRLAVFKEATAFSSIIGAWIATKRYYRETVIKRE